MLFIIIVYFLFWNKDSEDFSDLPNKDTSNNVEREKRDINKFVPCTNCKHSENHVDIRSKCDQTCKFNFPNTDAQAIGASKGTEGVQCECGFKGEKKQTYVNCLTPYSVKDVTNSDCFIWNKSDAERVCPVMCKKYLPNNSDYVKWTGKFDNTTIHTSACQCEYYG
jgi:nitrogen fixation-related uncharacterized protein